MFGASPVSCARCDVVRLAVWNTDVIALAEVPYSTFVVAGSLVVHATSAVVPPVTVALAP